MHEKNLLNNWSMKRCLYVPPVFQICRCYRAFEKHIGFQTLAGGFQTTVSLAMICKPSQCFLKHCLFLQKNLTFLLAFMETPRVCKRKHIQSRVLASVCKPRKQFANTL